MNDLKTVVDHAAQQNDRWLFLALLALIILFAVFIWRWIVSDREKLANRLTDITDQHIDTMKNLTQVVTNNTNALYEVKEAVAWCRQSRRRPGEDNSQNNH